MSRLLAHGTSKRVKHNLALGCRGCAGVQQYSVGCGPLQSAPLTSCSCATSTVVYTDKHTLLVYDNSHMLRAVSRTMCSRFRAPKAQGACGQANSRGRVRMAVTACAPDPAAPIEWDGLTSWRSFIDSRRGLDAKGKITAKVCLLP